MTQLTPKQNFCIAYSGGVDSHVLLDMMTALCHQYRQFRSRAVHINHGLSPHAKQWESHCHQICTTLDIPFTAYSIHIDQESGESLEAQARHKRYAQLGQVLNKNECLLTAHNVDDQVETVFLQLLRGAGVKGLAAMPRKKTLATTELLRPLLAFSREQILAYAKAKQLNWIEDESNADLRFERNFLRCRMMPILKERWPQLLTTVKRSADHCAEAAALMACWGEDDLQHIESDNHAIHIQALLEFPLSRRHNVLRQWIYRQGYPLPTTKQLNQLLDNVVSAQQDAMPILQWGNVEVRRYQHKLYIQTCTADQLFHEDIQWDLQQPLELPFKLGTLTCRKHKGLGLTPSLDIHRIRVGFRRGGERCHPQGRRHSQSLKKLFQEWQVLPWQRNRIPLIYCHDDLIAVVGYCIDQRYQAKTTEEGYQIDQH